MDAARISPSASPAALARLLGRGRHARLLLVGALLVLFATLARPILAGVVHPADAHSSAPHRATGTHDGLAAPRTDAPGAVAPVAARTGLEVVGALTGIDLEPPDHPPR